MCEQCHFDCCRLEHLHQCSPESPASSSQVCESYLKRLQIYWKHNLHALKLVKEVTLDQGRETGVLNLMQLHWVKPKENQCQPREYITYMCIKYFDTSTTLLHLQQSS